MRCEMRAQRAVGHVGLILAPALVSSSPSITPSAGIRWSVAPDLLLNLSCVRVRDITETLVLFQPSEL